MCNFISTIIAIVLVPFMILIKLVMLAKTSIGLAIAFIGRRLCWLGIDLAGRNDIKEMYFTRKKQKVHHKSCVIYWL